MKEKGGQRKTNSKKTFRKIGPSAAFFLTLGLVLLTGLSGMTLLKVFAGSGSEGQKENNSQNGFWEAEASKDGSSDDADGKGEFYLPWETIPQKEEKGQPELPESRYGAVLADSEYMQQNNIVSLEAAQKEIVSLGFVGDILMDDEYAIMAKLLERGGNIEDGLSEELLAKMREVDIMVVNNEFAYTNRGEPLPEKTYTFRASDDAVKYLHDMGADVAILANNHVFDFGEVGLLDTLDTLKGADIPYVGAGRDIEEASAPLYIIINDIKIAVVAATQIERLENPDTRGAGEGLPGVFRCLNPQRLYETVAQAKENSDFVIVYIHWGTEMETEPDLFQLDQAPKLAEAGADLIIGDHPHCLQGITFFGDTPVIYSLGNFWFNSRVMDTGMVRVEISREGIESFQFIPALQSDCRTDLVYGEEKERILSHMRELSPEVQIDQDGYVTKQK